MNVFDAKAFLFDMDGVLIDNTRYHVLSWLECAKKYGCELTEGQVVAWMGSPGREYIKRMFKRPDMPPDEIRFYLQEKEALYREIYAPYLTLNEGLREFLAETHRRGIACAIATGGSMANVNFVLDGLGIREHFAFVIDASGYERGKPFPDCYLKAAEGVGREPKDCIIFEDAVNGIEAARAARIPVVAKVGTNSREVLAAAGADCVIDSFVELMAGDGAQEVRAENS